MTQAIIFTNDNGGVSVCIPTGELSIQDVQKKDTPQGSIIVDTADLPQGADAQFFDAWELADGKVTVNFEKAKAIKLSQFNAAAVQEAQKRQLNTLAGLDNDVADADFAASLKAGRDAIANAQTTDDLALIANPV
jgi:hypothetical protein